MAVWFRRIALGALLVVLAMAALTARAVVEGREQMRLSEQAFDQGDVRTSLVHARRAAVLYAPGAPHVGQAYQRLIAIARGAEAARDGEMAAMAWRAVRGAALETRHVWVPRAKELEQANRALARLEAQRATDPAATETPQQAYRQALAELRQDAAPELVALLAVGFVLAALGLGLVAGRGVTRKGELVLSQAKLGFILALVGAACWTIAVWRA